MITVKGRYTSLAWTEWTQGFQYGCAILAFDGEAAAKACRVPALFINAGGIADTARFSSLCPQLLVEETKGAGHFHQLEVPKQINAMLDRFLAGITAAIM